MSSYWRVLLLTGAVAIPFGLAAYALPGLTLAALVSLFSAFAFVDGVFDAIQAFVGRKWSTSTGGCCWRACWVSSSG